MRRPLQVSGRVVDGQTGKPVEVFQVITGGVHLGHYDWSAGGLTNGPAGTFQLILPRQELPHVLQVEAEGYFPEISRELHDSEEEAVVNFTLNQGEILKGTVRLPDGQPAARALVSLCTEDKITGLTGSGFVSAGRGMMVETDDQGAFVFQPQRGVKVLAAWHPQGYAEANLDEFKQSNLLQLQPWARIVGTWYAGKIPATNQLVQLIRNGSYCPQFMANDFTVLSDGRGGFKIDHVPPGRHLLGRVIASQFSHGRAITVKSGETAEVILGKTGRTVTGSVVAADGRELDWETSGHPALLHLRLPPVIVPKLTNDLATNSWLRAYWDSAEGRARQVTLVP